MAVDRIKLAKMIDLTLLKAYATREDVVKLCEEGRRYGFAAVCVNPSFVSQASRLLKGSGVKAATVIGFPLGANTTEVKAFEAENAVLHGAEELDMVMNIGALKSGDTALVKRDIEAVVEVAKEKGVALKVIIEACYLTEGEKASACMLAADSGAGFVKTSTGFGASGATVEDVRLMKETVGERVEVKAAGGIRTYEFALNLIEAGASRLGTSSGVKIVEECPL
jgi:deoxyribose-phosphate aldolase